MNINDILLNLANKVPATVVGGIIGYFIKSLLEKRKRKKELHENSINALKKAKGVLSSKILSIKHDLVMVNPNKHLRSMRENLKKDFGKDILDGDEEIANLGKDRIIDNCDVINNINTDEFHDVFPGIAEIIEGIKNQCMNLKRIIKYKSDDESKIYLLDEVEGNISDLFSELMNKTRDIY